MSFTVMLLINQDPIPIANSNAGNAMLIALSIVEILEIEKMFKT